MAASEPYDILGGWPGWSTRFELASVSEISATRGGRQLARDLGPALWEADYATRTLSPLALRRWAARLHQLAGGARIFWGRDLGAGWPMAYPDGAGLSGTTCALGGVVGSYAVTLTGLPAAAMALRTGDYFSFAYGSGGAVALHQVMGDAVATGGVCEVEVRPAVRTGWSAGAPVYLRAPACHMALVPGSVSMSADIGGWGTLAFRARQTL